MVGAVLRRGPAPEQAEHHRRHHDVGQGAGEQADIGRAKGGDTDVTLEAAGVQQVDIVVKGGCSPNVIKME